MTPPDAKRLLIVRHGETESNAARVLQMPDSPLSAIGLAQAERLADRLQSVGVVRIVSSDYPRAMHTAAALARRLGIGIDTEPSLRERNFGDLRGTSYDSLGFSPFAPDYAPPNGESSQQFLTRVGIAWDKLTALCERTPGNVLVVTHGLVCRAIVEYHVHAPSRGKLPGMWHNTSVTEIVAQPPWIARLINCVAHLSDGAEPRALPAAHRADSAPKTTDSLC